MKKGLLILMAPVFFFGWLPAQAEARDEWQLWNNYGLSWKVTDDVSLKVTGEQRIGDDFSESFQANVSPGFLWHPSKHFEIGPFFKYEREKKAGGFHVNERRWLLEGTLKAKWGLLKLSDRNRIAYRDRNTTDIWRYRNRMKAAYPFPVKGIILWPYVSEELFFETNSGGYNQNRITMGMDAKIMKHVTVGLYYMIKSNRRDRDWSETQVLGTSLNLSF